MSKLQRLIQKQINFSNFLTNLEAEINPVDLITTGVFESSAIAGEGLGIVGGFGMSALTDVIIGPTGIFLNAGLIGVSNLVRAATTTQQEANDFKDSNPGLLKNLPFL